MLQHSQLGLSSSISIPEKLCNAKDMPTNGILTQVSVRTSLGEPLLRPLMHDPVDGIESVGERRRTRL